MDKVEKHKLKSLYAEIVRGYSITDIDFLNRQVYIKHFATLDSAFVDLKYQEIFDKASFNNISTRSDREKWLVDNGLWDKTKENELSQLRYFLQGLNKTKEKIFRENDIKQIQTQIKETKEKILKIEAEKEQYIGITAEDLAAKESNEFFIFKSFFSDSECKTPLFAEEYYQDLENTELQEILEKYNQKFYLFNTLNLQRIALSPFFLNIFYLCGDNLFELWGKPVIHLSFFQSELSGHARYFKSILSELKQDVSEDLLDNPDKLIEFYTGRKNANELLEKNQGKGGMTFLNASQKDLGNFDKNQTSGMDIFEKMQKSGKTRLTSEEFQKLAK